MLRTSILAMAVAIPAGLLGFAAQTPASAATAAFGAGSPAVETQSASNIELVASRQFKKRKFYYDRHRHGPRYRYRYGHNRYYHGGYWYARPWWNYGGPTIALGIGPAYGYGYGYGAAVGNSHVRWCLNHYRSYNPRTNTFVGYDGYAHQCSSPFDGY